MSNEKKIDFQTFWSFNIQICTEYLSGADKMPWIALTSILIWKLFISKFEAWKPMSKSLSLKRSAIAEKIVMYRQIFVSAWDNWSAIGYNCWWSTISYKICDWSEKSACHSPINTVHCHHPVIGINRRQIGDDNLVDFNSVAEEEMSKYWNLDISILKVPWWMKIGIKAICVLAGLGMYHLHIIANLACWRYLLSYLDNRLLN